MQDRGNAEGAAHLTRRFAREVTGILGKGGECRWGGAEQEIVNDPRPGKRQGAELMRQGEDDVEILDRQQVSASCLEPVGLSQGLTLRAMAIATGMVDGAPVPAAVTGFEMTTEGCSSTLTQGADHLVLDGTHPMSRRITLPMTAQEVAEFERRLRFIRMSPKRSRRLRRCTHGGLLRRVGREVEQVRTSPHCVVGWFHQMEITGC